VTKELALYRTGRLWGFRKSEKELGTGQNVEIKIKERVNGGNILADIMGKKYITGTPT